MEIGGILGWRPDDIYRATIPELLLMFRGWQRAQGIDPDKGAAGSKAMSRAEYEKLKARLQQAQAKKAAGDVATRTGTAATSA